MFGMLSKCIPLVLVLGMAGVATFAPLTGQDRSARHGTTERIKVHGRSLEGNLEGDSPDRDVSIYLPPTYTDHPNRRYPVLYMLHGFTDTDAKWFGLDAHSWMMPLPAIIDKALEEGATREMIVVMPNAYTRYKGSMYSNSITTGDWERFIAGDLVGRIDSHYRTIAGAASRGLAGHSMGGYGTIRIGMKYPDVFSSIYLMSPCCMTPDFLLHQGPTEASEAESIRTMDEVAKAGFWVSALFASSAAWAPAPKRPPFYLDLPFENGAPISMVTAKFAANAPLALIDQYIANIKRLHGIAFDIGTKDDAVNAATIKPLDDVLTSYGIPHVYETYDGNHLNHIGERIETKVLPFFSKNLVAQ